MTNFLVELELPVASFVSLKLIHGLVHFCTTHSERKELFILFEAWWNVLYFVLQSWHGITIWSCWFCSDVAGAVWLSILYQIVKMIQRSFLHSFCVPFSVLEYAQNVGQSGFFHIMSVFSLYFPDQSLQKLICWCPFFHVLINCLEYVSLEVAPHTTQIIKFVL